MKSYILDPVRSVEEARAALSQVLPDGVLRNSEGDPIAYFHVTLADIDLIGPAIIADVSGRHYNEDAAVVSVLEIIGKQVGGDIAVAP